MHATRYLTAATALCLSLASAPGSAADAPSRRSLLADARASLGDALHDSRDGGYGCRGRVSTDLEDIIDDLRDPSAKRLSRLTADLDDLRRDAKKVCPRGVVRDIDEALDVLEKAAGAIDKPYVDPSLPECWNTKDDACTTKRDGQFAMAKKRFNKLIDAVQREAGDLNKEDTLKSALKSQYLTTKQLAVLVEMVRSDLVKADVVKLVAPRVVDHDNAWVIKAVFRNSITGQEAVEAIEKAAPQQG